MADKEMVSKFLDYIELDMTRKKSKLIIEQANELARGDADPDSDMDILVVVDELTKEVEDYISDCAWEASFKHGIVMVPIVFSVDEWVRGPERSSLLAEAIREEGIFI